MFFEYNKKGEGRIRRSKRLKEVENKIEEKFENLTSKFKESLNQSREPMKIQ